MPRIPYVAADLPGPIADAIRVRRGDRGLTPLDRALLQAPPIAEGWSKLLGAVRTGSSLQDDLREIMVSPCKYGEGIVELIIDSFSDLPSSCQESGQL